MTRHRLYPALSALALAATILACSFGSAAPTAPAGGATSPAGPSSTSAPNPPTGGGNGSTPEACQNKYYPVVKGGTWDYSMTGAVTSQYTRSITDVRSDGFSEQTVFASGPTTTSEWQCDDGALVDLQPSAAASATFQSSSGMSMNFKTIETSGVTVPDNLGPGATWNQELTLEGTTTISGQDAKARNVMKMDCTGSNSESVTVPAGTFNAVRADCRIDSKITVTMSGVEVPTDVSTTSTMWYAPDVGLVKIAEVISGSDSVTIELTSYKIP